MNFLCSFKAVFKSERDSKLPSSYNDAIWLSISCEAYHKRCRLEDIQYLIVYETRMMFN